MPNAPLKVGAYGADVVGLQDSLRQLGFSVSASEMSRAFFGPATRQAVQQFQKDYQLANTGEFDQITEAALSAAAAALKPVPPPKATPGPSVGSSKRSQSAAASKPQSAPDDAAKRPEASTSGNADKTAEQTATLTALLSASPAITSAIQTRFVTLYNANTGSMPDFWKQLASDPQLGPVVPQLQLTLQLGTLTQNNSDLVAKLIAQFHPASTLDLTKLTADQLEQLMISENIQIPASVAATTTPATIAQYAASIISSLKLSFPTDYVAKSFATSSDPLNQSVATFLAKSPDFDFSATHIDHYLAANPTVLAGLPTDEVAAFTVRLKAAQRVFRTTPDGDAIQTLIAAGLDSSYKIATSSSSNFVAQYSDSLGGETPAQQIYANATAVTGATSMVMRQAQENASKLLPNYISGQGSTKPLDDNLPNWQELFGGTSTCQCTECRAIDGPAAYFVSLLQFLGNQGMNEDHNTPLDVLIGNANSGHTTYKENTNPKPIKIPKQITVPRRPDLAYLKLNCANADTALPYVDIVNEILENYVHYSHIDNNVLKSEVTLSAAHDTPGDATTAVLDVTPENMQTRDAGQAYEKLNAETILYPYSLPFDRYLETMRTYLNFLGISLYQLMQTCGAFQDTSGDPLPPLPIANQLAAEYLLISEPEFQLITGKEFSGASAPFQSLPACFGYPPQARPLFGQPNINESWMDQQHLGQVSTFLNCTGLTFDELVAILETKYLNPNHLNPPEATTLTIPADPANQCDVTAMHIQNAGRSPLPFLVPLPPFLRLKRKLGWTTAELDYALRTFGQAGVPPEIIIKGSRSNISYDAPIFISPEFIQIAAQIQQLTKSLHLSVSDLVSLWNDIDTDGRTSPYILLFQNKAIVNPPDPYFRLLYQVPLTPAPATSPPSVFPDSASSSPTATEDCVIYDPKKPQLSFIGGMTEPQRDVLLNWANTAGGSTENSVLAVQLLYSQRWYSGIQISTNLFKRSKEESFGIETDLVANHINVILSALRISAADLLAIWQDYNSNSMHRFGDARLSIGILSVFHRYAILARSLGLSVPDLITLKNLTGLQPFTLASGAIGPSTNPMVQFVTAAQQVAASPFSLQQLAYLYGPVAGQTGNLAPLQATQDAVMATILTGLQNIATANAFAPDPTGVALRKKLAVLIPSTSQLDATMGLIAGTTVYSTPLSALPTGVTLPASQPVSLVLTAAIGGTITAGDTVSLIVTTGVAGASNVTIGWAVLATDTPESIAAALGAQINANQALAAAGAVATVSGAIISLAAPPAATWTESVATTPPATIPTENVSLGGSLIATGPLSSADSTALNALLGANANFTNALQDLSNQALDVLTQNLGFLAAGGPTYTKALSALPTDVSLPSGSQVSFSGATGQLICNGPMLHNTFDLLLSASSSDAVYNSALTALFNQAWNPSGPSSSAIGMLIDESQSSTPADRYNYVLAGLLSYLTTTQSQNLVKQTLAQTLAMDPAVVQLLIEGNDALGWPTGLLPSAFALDAVPPLAGVNDFLGGLAAAYTGTSADGGTNTTFEINPGVDLEVPANETVLWRGKLLPPKTGAYAFAVTSLDGSLSTTPTLSISFQNVALPTPNVAISTVNLTAGQLYHISLAVPAATSSQQVTLQWCIAPAPLSTLATIPVLALMPCDSGGGYPVLAELYRIAVLVNGFSMSAAEMAYFSTHPTDFQGTDPATKATTPFSLEDLVAAAKADPPALFNQWQRLNAIYGLKATLPPANTTLIDVFAAAVKASQPNPSETLNDIVVTILQATGWNAVDLQTLAGQEPNSDASPTNVFNFAVSQFRNETALVQIAAALAISWKIGVSALQLFDWANPPAAAAGVSPYVQPAQDIQNTVKAKYDQAGWLQAGKPLNDKLRENSKDALIAFILYLIPNGAYSTVDDLYGFFLIDVEMCPCMETSRLVQASAAVQLFVQRCLLNLEPEVSPSAFGWDQITEWRQWRKNYRVWQAAVEVFLYPETWLDPTLRPNATPFFEDLETTLLQGSVNEDNVQAAFLAYLQSLQQVARLEIAGLYTEDDPGARRWITHVIGRTFATPHVYFYRALDNTTFSWSPWEQISADISGDTLIPVIWNLRLFLFWPIYTEVSDPVANSSPPSTITSQAGSNGQSATSVPQTSSGEKTLQIQMASTEYKSGSWTPKQLTKELLTPDLFSNYSAQLDQSTFIYNAITPADDGLLINVYSTNDVIISEAISTSQQAYGSLSTLLNICTANPAGNTDPGSSARNDTVQALTLAQAAIGQLQPFMPSGQYTTIYDEINNVNAYYSSPLSLTIEQVSNDVQTLSSVIASLQAASANAIAFLGSFFFDGSQGVAHIAVQSATSGGLDKYFTPTAAAYGLGHTSPAPGDAQAISELSFQDMAMKNSPFQLALSSPTTGSQFTAPLLFGTQGNLPAFTVTFPQQNLPSYAIDSLLAPIQKVAFYADGRRTYFVVNSPLFPQSGITDPSFVSAWSEIAPLAFFFFNQYHPWVGQFIKNLNWKGVPFLLDPTTQALTAESPPQGVKPFDFASTYVPSAFVNRTFPEEVVDFGPALTVTVNTQSVPPGDFAYAEYNWEIFFHIPLLVAIQLSQNQQFDDAEAWFRYIFDPTKDPKSTPPASYKAGIPNCYWRFWPFNRLGQDNGLQKLLGNLTAAQPDPRFTAQLQAWSNAPFEPDVIAQFRPVAYQKCVVMKYLDHLIRWGDYCFRQNTRESINEAIQFYILADEILGQKPVVIRLPGTVLDQTYYDLVHSDGLLLGEGGIYGLGNANVALENAFPFVVSGTFSENGKSTGKGVLPSTPYFCTPNNPTLLAYYDTVADRLYKIRHCMNIQGQVEQLALFSPPISPGLLVAAEAAGVDLSSVLNDIAAAVPHYRFTTVMAKALELCGEVRALGAGLLAAMEKYDAEGLALLRAGQEVNVQQALLLIKQQKVQEANFNYAGLQATQAVTTARQNYYAGLVSGGLSSYENGQVAALAISELFKLGSQLSESTAAGLAIIPQFEVGVNGVFGSPAANVTFGGQQLSDAARAAAALLAAQAEAASFVASMLGMMGGWDRRAAEWAFQLETATLELTQIQQQLNAANIWVQMASQDVTNQNLLIVNAAAVQSALTSKFTNQELYSWMVGKVSGVFFQCYQMAYDLAKRAEACYQFELGVPQSNYIQFGYWDSLKQGLLSGERLFQDLKRLEMAYLDQNLREYEISKSISLLLLDPSAFVSLKLTGQCIIALPEAFFDLDYPGHYMRRIRNVSLTVQCVTGPYTSVNCTLTLLQSRFRLNNNLSSGASPYAEKPIGSDTRFSYSFSSTESIATSTAQNDSGLFEVNFRDDRYLPFEGAGVISQWQLCMPLDCNACDFETITDLVFNLRYTARNGGDALRKAAKAAAILPAGTALQSMTAPSPKPALNQSNLQRYFSLRHEYPTEWYKFLHPAAGAPTPASMQINLGNERFPFQYRSSSIQITQAQFVIILRGSSSSGAPNAPSGLALTSGSNTKSFPPPNEPSIATPQTPAVAYLYTIPTPPAPAKLTGIQTGPPCWILQGSSALTDVVDIIMICTYSTTLGNSA
jgi:peptidoglycan hydrolase-like protein with peptidoglycan-binding domain